MWRGQVQRTGGSEGIRQQLQEALASWLQQGGVHPTELRGVGVGFGGPVDDCTGTVIKSHQIAGWDGFPLADWLTGLLGLPVALGNDADVAGLAEALFGAGKGLSPLFYITIGSGIGGGLIIDGEIYRGCGRGAAEIGHLRVPFGTAEHLVTIEELASGWGMEARMRSAQEIGGNDAMQAGLPRDDPVTVPLIAEAARRGDPVAQAILTDARWALAQGICHVIALLCPRRIVIGGGVSLLGEEMLFAPLRELVAGNGFPPFAGSYDIVPAALGEEVVVHGALALARRQEESKEKNL